LTDYFIELKKLLVQPILFFTKMPEGEWYEGAVTFVGITSMILSLLATFVVFITQYFPIGGTLLEEVSGFKILIVSPIVFVLIFVFFVITFSSFFIFFLAAILAMFSFLGVLIFWGGNILGGKGAFIKDIKASFYSSGVTLVLAAPIIFVLLVKNGAMDFTNFRIGYNMIYGFTVLFLYGLQAIIARKVHGLRKWKAFIVALLPFLFLIIVGILVDKIVLTKISPWIT